MHLSELPDVRSHRNPDGAAIADDDVDMSNAQFADGVRRVAAALRAHGVGPGDVVAVKLPNTTGLVVTLFAAWRVGAAVTPINPSLVGAEVDYQVRDAGAKIVVGDPGIDISELTSYPEVDNVPAHVCDDALALLIYTSGTTGRPKGVMLDHANLDAMCAMVIQAFALSSRDHSLLILPLFHVNAIVVSTLSPLLAGGRATIAGRFSPNTFFDRLERSRATYFSAVPTIYTMLADLPVGVTADTSAVRFGICGAAPARVQLLEKFEKRHGFPLIEGYGLSEGTCASTVNPLDGTRKPGTVGLPLSGQTIRIADAGGAPVADDEAGEVLIASPTVMRGYLNRPGETAKTVVNGWLHTGDIGRLDEDGYLMLVDRAKDMIIRGGENIYPKEIEAVVYELPGVAAAAVVGRPSAVYGEEPVLFVAMNTGATATADQILAHCRTSLSKYKLPVAITVLDELPRNAVGKLDKPTLRRTLAAQPAQDPNA